MARTTLTRRSFFSSAFAGLTLVLAGCTGASDASVSSEPLRPDAAVFDEEAPDELEFLMIGDVLVHKGVWQSGELPDGTRNYDHLFAQVADEVAAADVAIVEQETILGGTSLGLSGYPTFNSPQEIGDAEVAAGFDVALCASNHACDKGVVGIESALAYWRSTHPDVLVTGIYEDEEAFDELPLLEREGHLIAVLNYSYGMNGIPLPHDWSVRMLDEDLIRADVAAVREAGAEAVIACPHWGVEYAAGPDADQRRWAQVLVDAGADVIMGSHPHVLQPFEVVTASDGRAVPVFWSVGNFVSTQPRSDSMVGGIARASLVFEGGGCRVSSCRLTPVVTHRATGTAFTTYHLSDYTEELAAVNQIRSVSERTSFSRQWCVDFCAERLGDAFDPTFCELVWEA